MLVRKGGVKMAKQKSAKAKVTVNTTTRSSSNRVPEVPVSERKLDPHITIGFANKAPKFVVGGKHTVVYEK